MSNKFLTSSGDADISDGTATIFGATIGAANLIANMTLKTNATKDLVSEQLAISDISGLEASLTTKFELDFITTGSVTNPSTGEVRLFSDTGDILSVRKSNGTVISLEGGMTGGTGTWLFNTATAGDPDTGKLLWNNATPASMTSISISKVDIQAVNHSVLLATVKSGDTFHMNDSTGLNAKLVSITSAATDNSTYFTWTCLLAGEDNISNYGNLTSLGVDVDLQNPWNQNLNTTSSVQFAAVEIDTDIVNQTNSAQYSTGIISGGLMTINGDDTLFDITAGVGTIVDPDTMTHTRVSWDALPAQDFAGAGYSGTFTVVYMDSSGTPTASSALPTNEQRRNRIYLGTLSHFNSVNITSISNRKFQAINPSNDLCDLAGVIGAINVSGNILSSNSLLTVARSNGSLYDYGTNFVNNIRDPNILSIGASDTNVSDVFLIFYQDNSLRVGQTDIIPDEWDDGNGQALPGSISINNWGTHRYFIFNDGTTAVQPPQTVYATEIAAQSAINTELFNLAPSLNTALLVGFLVCRGGGSNLSNTNDCVFVQAQKFQTSGSSSSIQNFQGVYDNSTAPQVVTSATLEAVQFKQGSGSNNDNVFEILNDSNVKSFTVTGNGAVSAISLNLQQKAVVDELQVESTHAVITIKDTTSDLADVFANLVFEDQNSAIAAHLLLQSGILQVTNNIPNGDIRLTAGPSGGGSVIPGSNGATDLGSSSFKWKDLYVGGDVDSSTYSEGSVAGTIIKTGLGGVNNYLVGGTYASITGTKNISIGSESLDDVVGGTCNVVLGHQSGMIVTSGSDNVIVGCSSGKGISTTANNIVMGGNSMNTVVTGGLGNNTVIGVTSFIVATTADHNIVIGNLSMGLCTEGKDNTVIGHSAGDSITTGSSNVLFGDGTDCAAALDNQIAIGAGATTTAANECVIGNSGLEHIRPMGTSCDLGTTDDPFDNLFLGGVVNCSDVIVEKTAPIITVKDNNSDIEDMFANIVFADQNDAVGAQLKLQASILRLRNNVPTGDIRLSAGPSGLGNVIPIISGATNLGSSIFKWKDLYLGGDVNASGNVNILGTNASPPMLVLQTTDLTDDVNGEIQWHDSVGSIESFIKSDGSSLNLQVNEPISDIRLSNGSSGLMYDISVDSWRPITNNETSLGINAFRYTDLYLNGRVVTQVLEVTSTATLNINTALYNMAIITAQAVALHIGLPSNSLQGSRLTLRIEDNGVARAITYASAWIPFGAAKPTTTIAGKAMYIEAIYDADNIRWHINNVFNET